MSNPAHDALTLYRQALDAWLMAAADYRAVIDGTGSRLRFSSGDIVSIVTRYESAFASWQRTYQLIPIEERRHIEPVSLMPMRPESENLA